tara:strand:+ start:345 stop:560 length:216 start_codon:yes stop_codon:yes gene_type:complete
MPSKAKCKMGWKKMGYKSMSDCESYGKKKMTQKADTSSKDEKNKVGWDRASSDNARMFKRMGKSPKANRKY